MRRAAAHGLAEMGPEAKAAVPALAEALKDEASGVREAAAYAPYVLDGSLRDGSVPSLLVTESYADEWVPNESVEHYAGTLGLSRVNMSNAGSLPATPQRYVPLEVISAPVSGNVASGTRTAALALYHPASHTIIRFKDDQFEYEPEFPPFVELAAAIPCPVRLLGLRNGEGKPAGDTELAAYSVAPNVSTMPGAAAADVVSATQTLAGGANTKAS